MLSPKSHSKKSYTVQFNLCNIFKMTELEMEKRVVVVRTEEWVWQGQRG